MEKIGLITDSTCDLEMEYLLEKNIKLVPTRIIYSHGEYRDRLEIEPKTVYENFSKEIPKTSMPSPDDMIKAMDELYDEGCTHAIGIFVSEGLSGTYNIAKTMAAQNKKLKIEIIDSKSLSYGLGFVVMDAQEAIERGADFGEVIEVCKKSIDSIRVYFALTTLKYLRAGGRIGYVEGTIAEILNIKPVITIEHSDGKYRTYAKVRGMKKALSKLREIVDSYGDCKLRLAPMHGDLPNDIKEFVDYVRTKPNVESYKTGQICPVLSVHTGPGLIGVVIQKL